MYQINDHLWEGSFYPRPPNGRRKKFNVYAETKEQCEAKLDEMIAEKKAALKEKEKLKEAPNKAPQWLVGSKQRYNFAKNV